MYKSLIDNFGVKPDVSSWLYADAYLRSPIHKIKKNKKPNQPFWYRGRLWVPLSCAITISDSGNAHISQGGNGTSSSINTTGASLLVAYISESTTSNPPTDSKSNTWTGLTSRVGSFANISRLWYVANPAVGSGHTFTLSASTPSGCFVAFDGVSLSSPFDQENGSDINNDPTSQPGSITPSVNDTVVLTGLGGVTDFPGGSINSGYTITNFEALNLGNFFSSALAYIVQTTATATNPTWTWSQTVTPGVSGNSVVIANFKPAGGATAALRFNALLNGISASGPFFANPLGYPVH